MLYATAYCLPATVPPSKDIIIGGPGARLGQSLEDMSDGESVLERRAGRLKLARKLLSNCLRYKSAKRITNDDGPDPP